MKIIAGLGNPGPRYDGTRHNVGWWVADRLAYDWGLGPFHRAGAALVTGGVVKEHEVRVMKPTTYVNRSGVALGSLRADPDLTLAEDLLVVVDDAMLEVARVKFRPSGSAGGHNGLKSVQGALGTQDFARLRIGVGRAPEGRDLADWVLSPMSEEDEDRVVGLLPELTQAVELWMTDGIQVVMDRFNR